MYAVHAAYFTRKQNVGFSSYALVRTGLQTEDCGGGGIPLFWQPLVIGTNAQYHVSQLSHHTSFITADRDSHRGYEAETD